MKRCKVGELLAAGALSQPDRATLAGWLDNGRDGHGRRVSAETLAAALADEGHDTGPTTLKAHRRGACVCYREKATP